MFEFFSYIGTSMTTSGTPLWLGLLTLAISIVGAIISVSQFILARDKMRFELFDKRFKAYQKILTIITECLQKGEENISFEDGVRLRRGYAEGRFLFGNDITMKIDRAAKSIMVLKHLHTVSKAKDLTDKQAEIQLHVFQYLNDLSDELPQMMSPYLSFKSRRIWARRRA